jgi:hypothetical protein
MVFSDRSKPFALTNCHCPDCSLKRQLFYQFSTPSRFYTTKAQSGHRACAAIPRFRSAMYRGSSVDYVGRNDCIDGFANADGSAQAETAMQTRRVLLAGGAGATLALGGLAYRAWDRGVWSDAEGPAYLPWSDWQGKAADGPPKGSLHNRSINPSNGLTGPRCLGEATALNRHLPNSQRQRTGSRLLFFVWVSPSAQWVQALRRALEEVVRA